MLSISPESLQGLAMSVHYSPPVYALSLTYTHTHTDAKAVKSWIKCFPGKAVCPGFAVKVLSKNSAPFVSFALQP